MTPLTICALSSPEHFVAGLRSLTAFCRCTSTVTGSMTLRQTDSKGLEAVIAAAVTKPGPEKITVHAMLNSSTNQEPCAMSIPRLLVSLVLLLLAALLAASCYVHYANLERHREFLQGMVSDATGRDFTIAGTMDVDLWPAIRLQMEDLSLANASWGSEPEMLKIARVDAAVAPLSLLSGPIIIKGFELSDVAMLLETGEDGSSNWAMADPNAPVADQPKSDAQSAPREPQGLPALVDTALMKDIVLTVRREGLDDQIFSLDELALDSMRSDQIAVTGKGKVLALPLELSGNIGTLPELTDRGAGAFELKASLGQLAMDASGYMASLNSLAGSKLKLSVESPELEQIISDLGLSLPFSGPLAMQADFEAGDTATNGTVKASVNDIEMDGQLKLQPQKLQLDAKLGPLNQLGALFEVEGLPGEAASIVGNLAFEEQGLVLEELSAAVASAKLKAEGTLASGDEASEIKVQATGDSLAELMASLPPVAFDASTTVTLAGTRTTLKPLQTRFGNSDIAGWLELDTAEGTDLKARLESKLIDAQELTAGGAEESAPPPAKTADPGAAPAGTTKTPDADAPKSKYVFTEDPLPWEALQNNNLDILWNIGTLKSATAELSELVLQSTLQEGDLKAGLDFEALRGGGSSSRIELSTAGESADLKASVMARDLRLNILGGDIPVDDMSQTSITIELDSTGGSPRQLAASSNGSVLITQGPGKVDNALMGTVTTDVFAQLASALNPFAKKDPFSIYECGIIAIDIKDGVSELDPIVLQQEKVMIVAAGQVDLNTENIALEFNTKPRSGIGVSADMFVTPFISLKGTLASPTIGMNETGTLMAAGTAGAAVATGGLSLLVQGMLNRAQGETDHCKETLPNFSHPPMAAQKPESTAQAE
jgi:uncharacterized protein involved in outer membrane biogenesis